MGFNDLFYLLLCLNWVDYYNYHLYKLQIVCNISLYIEYDNIICDSEQTDVYNLISDSLW